MSWIDPNLLQLIGRGTRGDEQVPDGRHLRWFFGRLLGFPRRGFLLRRHPSYATRTWDGIHGQGLIRRQALSPAELGGGSRRRFPSGLTVGRAGGFAFEATRLRLDATPVTLDVGAEGPSPVLPPSPFLSSPAAFVRLIVVRRQRTGHVLATGSYGGEPRRRFLDRAGVGSARVTWLDPALRDLAVATRRGVRLRSGAEARFDAAALDRRDDELRALLRSRGELPPPLDRRNPLVAEMLLLHGGLLEHVEVTGHDAALQQVEWITVRDYAAAPTWTELGRFFLPLTDAPAIYPAWSAEPGREIARERLHRGVRQAAPFAQVPWDDPVAPVTAASLLADQERRYLDGDDAFASLDEALRLFLAGELRDFVPQAHVEVRQLLQPIEGDDEEDELETVTRPFDFAYGAAADPRVARMLGLMTTDTAEPDGTFDYVVQAVFPDAWIERTLFPKRRPRQLGSGQGCLSMATAIAEAPAPPPIAAEDLDAHVVPDVSRTPVQAFVELDWRAETASLFESPDRARVFYSLERSGDDGEVLVHEREPESKLLMPHHPTPREAGDPRRRLADTNVPAYGTYTWRLAGMDLWGRLTPPAGVTADVLDVIAPPAPKSLEATLSGDTPPIWSELSIAFDWTASSELLAPDLDHFEIHLRQGEVSSTDAGAEASWGRLEHTLGATGPPLVVRWPSFAIESVPAGLTATVSNSDERVNVRFGPIHAAFDARGEAQVSATVRAVDVFGNRSGFALRAVARRVDDTPPVTPPLPGDLIFTSRPDAEGRVFHTIAWPDLGGGRVLVLRAPETSLLGMSGSDPAAFAALSAAERAAFLRGLALAHREAFAPDHEQRYDAAAGSHTAQFDAAHRGFFVFVVRPISITGVPAPWPTDPSAFLVVAVQRPQRPRTPLVREVRAGDRSVTLTVARDLTGASVRLRLYRGRRVEDLADVRTMRPLGELVVPADGDDLQLVDSSVYADVDYWYRVVAHAQDGTASAPTEALRARTYSSVPPEAPRILSVARDALLPHLRAVTCVVARRDYSTVLLRRARGTLDWHATPVDFSGSTPVAAGYRLTIEDAPPDAAGTYLYRLRVEDGRGRTAESDVEEEAP